MLLDIGGFKLFVLVFMPDKTVAEFGLFFN
jgi:hypothetical protein